MNYKGNFYGIEYILAPLTNSQSARIFQLSYTINNEIETKDIWDFDFDDNNVLEKIKRHLKDVSERRYFKGGYIYPETGGYELFSVPKDAKLVSTWTGRGYTGGHVSQIDWDTDQEYWKIIEALKQGFYVKDTTKYGQTSGYYPEVEMYK